VKNLKFYLVSLGVVFSISLFVTIGISFNKIRLQKIEIARLSENNYNLTQEGNTTTTLLLKQKEVTGRLRRERDSIARVLDARARNIIRLTYTTIHFSVSQVKPVPVKAQGKNTWQINDSTACFVWKGSAQLTGDSLKVNRLLFRYDAKVNSAYYKRRPKMFLGIPFGRFIFTEVSSSQCGSVQTKNIEFTR